MIETKINKTALWAIDKYLDYQLRNSFHSFKLIGELPQTDPQLPMLILPNHSSWWDGFFVYLINKLYFNRNLYIMIIEETLEKFPFFKKVGAFSINQQNPKDILKSLHYAAMLLSQSPSPMVNIYPQGVLKPDFAEVFAKSGFTKVIDFYNQPLNVLSLSMKTHFANQKLPYVFFKFGENHILSNSLGIKQTIENELNSNMLIIRETIDRGEPCNVIFGRKED